MESNRILYSDTHCHHLLLSEQEMGIIQHALYTLKAAFALEAEYLRLITDTAVKFEGAYKTPVVERERENV